MASPQTAGAIAAHAPLKTLDTGMVRPLDREKTSKKRVSTLQTLHAQGFTL
jgi:hypothetical protein